MTIPSGITVPPGFTAMTEVLEEVPNPNFGTPYGQNYFVRWTYRTKWTAKNITVSDGSPDACSQQAWALYQASPQGA